MYKKPRHAGKGRHPRDEAGTIFSCVSWMPACAGMTLLVLAGTLHAAELRMDKSVCQLVNKHVPDADVAYQPGVDAEGRKVAPADINPSTVGNLEDQISIKLTNQTAKVFGIHLPEVTVGQEALPLADMETQIGYVTLRQGRAYLNGKPLDSASQDELAVLCMEKK